jgi:pSer/pThr/pTyr-binding forkhead associated (FHA) protein
MQTCRHCHAQQLDGVLFCAECGASLFENSARRESTVSLGQPLPGGSQPLQSSAVAIPPAPPAVAQLLISLVVLNSGRRMTLDGGDELLVGRKDNARGIFPDVDLGLDGGYDAGVSRRHAIITPRESGWMIEDLGSANGTFVNGKQVPSNTPVPLRSGDELKFGTLLLRVEL